MKTIYIVLIFTGATMMLMACNNQPEPVKEESDLIEITAQQFKSEAMQLGEIETRIFENRVTCNGTIIPLPDGMANVSAPVSGIIKSIACHNGQNIRRNQKLIEVTGNEIIDLQKEFAEASAQHKRLQNEYERIKSLYIEKVTSGKDFILAETEFKISTARYNGLKLKIENIGLPVSNIEKGELYSSYFIKSPLNGTIGKLKVHIGSYIDSGTELAEIINPNRVQIKLALFAGDVASLKTGQPVRYRKIGSDPEYLALLNSIGIAIDETTKTVDGYAALEDSQTTHPLANEFVEAEIITKQDTVRTLPNDALIKTEKGFAILILDNQKNDNYYFKPVEVIIGRQDKGYTEILSSDVNGRILIKGGYNLMQE